MAEDDNKERFDAQSAAPEQNGAGGSDSASHSGVESSPFSGLYGSQSESEDSAGGVQAHDAQSAADESPTGADTAAQGVSQSGAEQSTEPIAQPASYTDNPYETNDFLTTRVDASPAPQYGAQYNAPYGQQTTQQYSQPEYGQYAYGQNMPEYGQYSTAYTQPDQAAGAGAQYGAQSQQAPTDGAGADGQQYGANFGGATGPAGPVDPNNPNGQQFVPGNGGNGSAATRRKLSSNTVTAIVSAVVTAVLCLGIGYTALVNGWVPIHSSSSMTGISSNTSGEGTATPKGGAAPDWVAVSKQVSNAVVSIQTQVQGGEAKGSGAVLDTEGHIVTNNHVISGGQDIQVTLANGQMYKAKVTGTDPTTDLAVIQLENAPKDLTPAKFANSDKLAVGENIMAVGNPLGYDDTATTGIVSALNRPVSVMDDNQSQVVTNAVQIDAAINPGNSGGPTFNVAGEVIGINSSIATASSSSQGQSGSIGIGFAIPSNLVKRIADEIVSDGSAKHVMLGVTIKDATVEADGINRSGAQITKGQSGQAVTPGSPAAKAGLKEGDTVVAFNGNAVGSNSSLLGFVRASGLNDKVKLTVVRNGKTMDVDVTLDKEESQVSGSNKQENGQNGQGGQGQGQQGQGQGGNGLGGGQGQGQDGNGGGLFDPFGLW